jgi:hypothetical protein
VSAAKETPAKPEHREPTFALAIEIVAEEGIAQKDNPYVQSIIAKLHTRLCQIASDHDAYIRAKCGTII